MKYYGLTLKYVLLSEIPKPEDYEQWIYNLQYIYHSVEIVNSCYELDSAGRLHYHCMFTGPDRIIYKSLLTKNFHQHFDVLKLKLDIIKWNNYINQEKPKHVEYMFIDNDNICA